MATLASTTRRSSISSNPARRFSTSEEKAWKTCRLAHLFKYGLRFSPTFTNRKLSLGTIVHKGLEAYYLGFSAEDLGGGMSLLNAERWEEIVEAGLADDEKVKKDFAKDTIMAVEMVFNYIKWVTEEGLDDDYETVGTEVTGSINIPGFDLAVLPVKMDLIQRNLRTERLRIIDFKTAAQFSTNMLAYQMGEQTGNYNLGVFAMYDEFATEFSYRELRKIVPSARSKPPYFRHLDFVMLKEEMATRLEDWKAAATEALNPDRAIYPSPANCCGSWMNDWQVPCLKVYGGMDPLEALEDSDGFAPRDPYERYGEENNG